MNRPIFLVLFAALVCAQLALPTSMILGRETVLTKGQEYKIRTRPIDPNDAFRGRFVQLGYDAVTIPLPGNVPLADGQKAYALMDMDSEGFAVVNSISFTPPDGTAYLKVQVRPGGAGTAQILWPFDRYYMEETAAPEAERLYRQQARNATAYITVRIWNGTGVITGLYLEGQPIEQKIQN